MSDALLSVEEQIKPRFEFRSFGQNFDEAAKHMASLSVSIPEIFRERHSDETYILSRTNDVNNTKIRDGKIDIKTLVQTVEGLEQWTPLMKGEFPMDAEILKIKVFPAFKVSMPELIKRVYTYEEFMDLIQKHPDLQAVQVHKQRFGYRVNDTICEAGTVFINDVKVQTISIESTETDLIKKTIAEIGLKDVENINYLQAIKRVIGMINKPLAN